MLFRSIEPLNPFPHRMQQCGLFLLSLSEDLVPRDSWIPIHSATPHFEWNISGSPSATQRDKPSCNNDQQTSGLKSFLHSHSLRSFGPPSGFLFGSLVLTQTTANNVDARYWTHSPQPRCFLSSTCPTTILRLGSLSLSSHLGTNPS